jgi:hypothetical protein
MGSFDKPKFAELLDKAKGNRSINQYGLHSGVDAGYISRLLRKMVEAAPLPPTLKKLADKAYNGITYEDFMIAAGHLSLSVYDNERRSSDTVKEEITPYYTDPMLIDMFKKVPDLTDEEKDSLAEPMEFVMKIIEKDRAKRAKEKDSKK